MPDQEVKTIWEQADQLYHNAQQELFKPEEDVVNYAVCYGAFKAAYKYLYGYLLSNGVTLTDKPSLESLMEQCRKIEPRFRDLNLEKFYHATEEEDVWMSVGTAQEFMDMASQTKKMVAQ